MVQTQNIKENLLSLFSEKDILISNINLQEILKKIIEKSEIPNTKDEEWKNTSLNGIFKHKFVKEKK